MSVNDEKKSWRVLAWELEDRLAEFKRLRADPNFGLRRELLAMADLVELVAEIERQLALQMDDSK